jgi:putative membrane protein
MYRLVCARSSISFGRSVLDRSGTSETFALAEVASLAPMVGGSLRQSAAANCRSTSAEFSLVSASRTVGWIGSMADIQRIDGPKVSRHRAEKLDNWAPVQQEECSENWVRTALAILAGAMVMQQLARHEPQWAVVTLTCSLASLAALLSVCAYQQWRRNQSAMRHAMPLPPPRLVPLLAVSVTILSIAGIAAVGLS